ncbi:MAG: amidohydrolase [Oscillospiraceae bacterium]|nr:amidohydrolase [Oscillospiraceae bacterium]
MIRFYNGRVVTMTGQPRAEALEVWTDGNSIAYVGPPRDDGTVFEREIDMRGGVLLPGFKDAHTHSAMTFLRSFADDEPLDTWLHKKVFPYEAKLTGEDVYAFAKVAVLEYLTSGITASFDMYFHNDAYVAANTEYGFRTVMCGAINDFDKRPEKLEDDYLKYNAAGPLIAYRLGFHAEYTTGRPILEYVASLAKKYRAPVYTHNSETKAEVEGCLERCGMTPTELFESLGIYDHGGGGFHCVWMTENDMDIFRRRGVYAVTNPSSNLKLASGLAPLCELIRAGVGIAVGTDGPASNNALDMFREMYLAAVLPKIRGMDAAAMDAADVLKSACSTGALAMGLPDCDSIAAGKKADLVLLDVNRPNMQPEHNIVKNIVYAGSKENVRLTMVNGKVLYEDGEFFVGEEPEKVYAEAGRLAREITA